MLIEMPPSREEWLALRQKYVGASESAALFGVQAAYALDAFALHHVKAGNAPPPPVDGPRVEWGKRLEQIVALAVNEEHGYPVRKGRYAVADDCPGMGASLDFEMESDPTGAFEGPGVLETKNVDWMIHRRSWTDGEPPLHVLIQLQHQLGATGWSWGAVACLVGGNDLRLYPYAAKPKLIADIKARVAQFWAEIAAGKPPLPSASESAGAILRSLFPEPIDDSLDMRESNEFPEAAAAFIKAQVAKKEAALDYDEARNRMELLLAGHKRAWGGGYSVNVAVTPGKAPRAPKKDEMIPGRKESRKFTVKIREEEMAA